MFGFGIKWNRNKVVEDKVTAKISGVNWDRIKEHLINRDISMYFAGGTLCLDIEEIGMKVLYLNVDGKAFTLDGDWSGIMPKYINDIVQDLYIS
jgi:hypothetical protein